MYRHCWLVCLLPFLFNACTTTNVKKDPGPHDHGFRYYRPKPYLLVQPTLPGTADKFAPDEMVSISLAWLPDFSEEYSIHVRAGLGVNKTNFKLQDGWNLTEMNIEVDSKFADNVKAVGELIKAVAPKGMVVPSSDGPPPTSKFVVRATNVPMGYYESVLGKGPDGKKRLYGWRYVGFAPYASCPVEPSGIDCVNCETHQLFGLVFSDGVMTFRPLRDIGEADTKRIGVPTTPPIATPAKDSKVTAFVSKAISLLNKTYMLQLTDSEVGAIQQDRKFIVNIKVAPAIYDLIAKMQAQAVVDQQLSHLFAAIAVEAGGDMSFSAEVHLAKKQQP